MATVYRAEDIKHGRTVAIKVLSADLSGAIGADRFLREVHIAARLQHPHILPVHDSGEAAGLLYYVMPFVEGESVRDRILRESQLPVDDAVAYAIEVAGALGYAHSQGVIHRDVKPENILIAQGHAVVADFGIARAASEASAEKLTQTGVSMGTAAYMSPEQFAGNTVDARSDVYSLGCVLFEMLVGQVPFTGPNMMAIMARHTMEQVPGIRIVRASVPEDVEDAVFRAMEKSPADRFQSMDDFRKALSGGGTGTWTRTRQHTSRYPARVPNTPWYRRRAVVAVLAIAAIAAITASVLYRRKPPVSTDANKLAVLYFEDRSPDGHLKFLGDALTESLIDQLTDAGGFSVVSRTGVEPLRARGVDADSIPAVARRLGVGSVVRGSVEPARRGIQVNVALYDASGDEFDHRSFTHATADLQSLRDSVGAQVADFLRQRLGREVTLREARSRTTSVQAWELAQRAERRRKDAEALPPDSAAAAIAALVEADSLLVAAERLDPKWPDAPAIRSRVALRRMRMSRSDLTAAQRWSDEAVADANRALALDPRDADALEMRGTARYQRVNMKLVTKDAAVAATLDSAEQDLLAAVRWRPTQATAWAALSFLYYRKPDIAEAKNAAVRAYETDAYLGAADVILSRLFFTNYDQEQFAQAQRWCDEYRVRFPGRQFDSECQLWLQTAPKGIRIDPDNAWRLKDSLVKYAAAAGSSRNPKIAPVFGQILVAGSLARAGLADSARHVLLEARRESAGVDPDRDMLGYEAVVRVILGDRKEALQLIKQYLSVNPTHRKGFATGSGWWWRDIQTDPEFRRLVEASG